MSVCVYGWQENPWVTFRCWKGSPQLGAAIASFWATADLVCSTPAADNLGVPMQFT